MNNHALLQRGFYRSSGNTPLVNVTGPGGINTEWGLRCFRRLYTYDYSQGQVKRETIHTKTKLPLRQLGDQEVDIKSMAASMSNTLRTD